jgi:hypothetical protein
MVMYSVIYDETYDVIYKVIYEVIMRKSRASMDRAFLRLENW